MPEATSWTTFTAVLWLAILMLVALAYLLNQIRQSEYTLWENCLYLPTVLMGRLVWRVRFTNTPPPELQNGAVLVANHRSSVDPFFVQLAARRRVHWMVAKEYCQHFLFGPILRLCQVIPTNRSGMDTASTKSAIRITREGRLVGMFPEGRINRSDAPLLPVKSGAAVVATKAGVPLIPLWIEGSPYRDTVWSPVFMPAQVTITFGTPILSATEAPPIVSDTSTPQATSMPDQDRANATTRPPNDLPNSDQLILSWGTQILAMAKRPAYPLELASARRKRRKNRNSAP